MPVEWRIGAEIMVCLDTSKSMLAEDVAPNRLERAKAEVADLLAFLDEQSEEIFLEIEKLSEENQLLAIEEEESAGVEALAGPLAPVEEIPGEPEIAAGEAPESGADLQVQEPIKTAPELPYDQPLLGVVTEVDSRSQTVRVSFAPGVEGSVALEDVSWAREPDPGKRPRAVKRTGDSLGVQAAQLRVIRQVAPRIQRIPNAGDSWCGVGGGMPY